MIPKSVRRFLAFAKLALASEGRSEKIMPPPNRSERLEGDDCPCVLDARDHLNLLVDEMSDVDAGVDIDLHQQIEFARGRIDFGGDLGVGEAVGHLVGLAELAFDLDEERDHGTSAPNPAKSTASGK